MVGTGIIEEFYFNMLRELVDKLTQVTTIGVDVGSSAIKIVELTQANGDISLKQAKLLERDTNQSLSSLLKEALSDIELSKAYAVLGIACPELIVKPLKLPPMPSKELKSAIQLEAEGAILNGHSPNEMAIDWHALGSHSNKKESQRSLLAVVPKQTIEQRMNLFKTAGLHTAVIDVEGLALWNAYWALVGRLSPDADTVLLINVGDSSTNIVVAKGRDELLLIRDLKIGKQAILEGKESEWLSELADSLIYARSQSGLRVLDSVYLTGGGSNEQTKALIQTLTPASVRCWNPLEDLRQSEKAIDVNPDSGALFAVAIGLALRKPL